jgi:hypothetical protein
MTAMPNIRPGQGGPVLGTRERTAILGEEMPRKPLLLREPPRSRALGLGVAFGSVALCTAAIYPLKTLAPAVSLGVVYLLAVIVVSIFWGGIGVA